MMTGSTETTTSSFPLRTSLNDGTRVLIRPLVPEDSKDLLTGFKKLSTSSRRFRFLTPLRKLSAPQLKSLTEVDQVNHVAIGVRDIGCPEQPGIAIGRFVRLDEDPRIAEFAVTVIDEYQKRGIGTLLMTLLQRAAGERGIEVLRGFVLEDNAAMVRLLEKFGARFRRDSGNVLQADVPVSAAAGSTRAT